MPRELTWQEEAERSRTYDHPSSRRAARDREEAIGPRGRLVIKQGKEREDLRQEQDRRKKEMEARHDREQHGVTVRRDAWTGKVVDHELIARQQRELSKLIEKHRRQDEELKQQHRDEWERLRREHTSPTPRPAA